GRGSRLGLGRQFLQLQRQMKRDLLLERRRMLWKSGGQLVELRGLASALAQEILVIDQVDDALGIVRDLGVFGENLFDRERLAAFPGGALPVPQLQGEVRQREKFGSRRPESDWPS